MKKKYLGLKQQFFLLSLCSGSLMASHAHGGPTIPGFIGNTADVLPPIPVTALPTGGDIIQGIDSIRELTPSQMEITQNAPKAVIHWQTFNIGSKASVNFSQKDEKGKAQSGWAALNAIGDASPSQIHGRLTADGAVYLINRNGIFFGPSAQVNVHSLTASALNLKEEDFINGYTDAAAESLTFGNKDTAAVGSVENSGVITAADGGQVFLIGGKAVNNGTITAKSGMVALAAGDEVTLTQNSNIYRYTFPFVTTTGETAEVTNRPTTATEPSLLQADEGVVGLYGGIVNQDGRVIATTAISRNGLIELHAHKEVNTGPGSITATPVTTSTERQTPPELDKDIKRGLITVNTKKFVHQGTISSPGGTVTIKDSLEEKNAAGGGKVKMEDIHLEAGSSIDVSGMWVDQTIEDRILDVQLNSDVLKNAYALKGGPLQGEKVLIDILNGMKAADISAYLKNRPRSAAERLTTGGTVELDADRVETEAGSRIDFSGGGYHYAGGDLDLTMIRVGSKILSLSDLPAGTPVDEVMGIFTRNHERYGIRQTWNGLYYGAIIPIDTKTQPFTQGSDAGKLLLTTPYFFMAGELDGWAERGIYQDEEEEITYTDVKNKNDPNFKPLAIGRRMPKGGTLEIGNDVEISSTEEALINEVTTHAISIVSQAPNAPADTEGEVPESLISAEIINNAGLSALELHAATTFNVAEDTAVRLAPGGKFNASARQIVVDGSIQAAGGAIGLTVKSNKNSFSTERATVKDEDGKDQIVVIDNEDWFDLEENLTLSGTAVLDVAGEKISNTIQQPIRHGYTKGGTITLINQSSPSSMNNPPDLNPNHGYDLTVAKGSRLSVQGGYWQGLDGSTKGADSGSLIIRQDISEPYNQELPENLHLTVDGDLEGHALLGKNGGSLTIAAHEIAIYPAAGSPPSFEKEIDPLEPEEEVVIVDEPDEDALPDTEEDIVTLDPEEDIPQDSEEIDPQDIIVFADNRFARTGFSSITFETYANLLVTADSHLTPSALRRTEPEANPTGLTQPQALSQDLPEFIDALPLEAGFTKIALQAGLTEGKNLTIEEGAVIAVQPEGEISLAATGLVTLGGILDARAGAIDVEGGEVTVEKSAGLLAQGINLAKPERVGPRAEINWKVLDGGSVTIESTLGPLAVKEGATINVSGSPAVVNTIEGDAVSTSGDNPGGYFHRSEAGSPGSVTFTFWGNDAEDEATKGQGFTLEGTLFADAFLPGLPGGSLTIERSHDKLPLSITEALIEASQIEGFDDLRYASATGIDFSNAKSLPPEEELPETEALDNPSDTPVATTATDSPETTDIDDQTVTLADAEPSVPITISAKRRLILDAPQIKGSNGEVFLSAPWVQLVNTKKISASDLAFDIDSERSLTVNAGILDISGDIRINGFAETNLTADEVIRLTDSFYKNANKWSGNLTVNGNLTLQAKVVYPTTGSIFSVKATEQIEKIETVKVSDPNDGFAPEEGVEPEVTTTTIVEYLPVENSGNISILPQEDPYTSSVYSAGGRLTITGANISHAGYLAAPMGSITMTADKGAILMEPESRISVTGTENVVYGTILDGEWRIKDKNGKYMAMTLPTPSITLSAHDVLIAKGSRIDADGGGSLTAYEFLPGLDGTANPLPDYDDSDEKRLVIVPDNSLALPELGEIYIEGYSDMGLEPGIYSILPAEFAFVPGAFILERGASGVLPGQDNVNRLHQPVIAGYERPFGSDEQPASMTGYILRSAADVLKEGKFDRRVESVNDGGNISISSQFSENQQTKKRQSDDTLLLLGDISASGVNGGQDGGLTIAGSSIHYAPVPEDLQKIAMQEKGLLNLQQLVEQERTIVLLEEGIDKIQAIRPANLVKEDKKNILADLEEDLRKLQSMPPEELAKEGREALLTQMEDDILSLRQLVEEERAIALLEKGLDSIEAINLKKKGQLTEENKKDILADLKNGLQELQTMTLGEHSSESRDSIVVQVQTGIAELQAVMQSKDFTEEKQTIIVTQLQGGLEDLQAMAPPELIEADLQTTMAQLGESLAELHTQTEIIPGGLTGNVYFDNTLLQGNGGLSRLTLGDYDPEATAGTSRTETISFDADQTVSGIPLVELKAEKSIDVGENTLIEALATDRFEGKISLTTAQLTSQAGSLFHAANELAFHVSDGWDFQGAWQVDDGRILFDSNLITLGSAPDPTTNNGMFISNDMLATLADIKEIEIESKTDIRFLDDVTLTTSGSLLLDSQRLLFKGVEAPEEQVTEEDIEVAGDDTEPSLTPCQVSITADTLRLRNSHDPSTAKVPVETLGGHSLEFNARELTLGPGAVRVDGFTDVALNPQGSLFFEGQGSFEVMLPESGILSLTAAGFYAAFPEGEETLVANRFLVSSGSGEALFQNSGETAPESPGVPGNLTVTGRSITMDGALLDFPGGRVELAATGTEESDGVVLKNGTQIMARGGILRHALNLADESATVDFHLPGGEVLISAASGQVEFASGDGGKNTIDVSADDEENGGRVIIKAPRSTLDLEGISLFGGGGEGGSFELITQTLPELGDLADVLSTGGFTNEVGIQIREGDINLAADKTLEARSITLAADGTDDPDTQGNITIAGTIKASGETGGNIAVYANQALTLEDSGVIEAKGTAGSGGKVILGSENGMVITDAGSTIDTMGGGTDTDNDGSVTFRVDLTETLVDGATTYDVLLDANGDIQSGQKVIQAVKTYSYEDGFSVTKNNVKTIFGDIAKADLATNAATTWIGASYRFIDGLSGYKDAGYTLLPEIEVRSNGSLTLTSGFQSGSGPSLKDLGRWRPDGLPGVLSFRAAGNLKVETNITDVPTELLSYTKYNSEGYPQKVNLFRDIQADGLADSWSLNFIAGADLTAANPLATAAATDLTGPDPDNDVGILTIGSDTNNKTVVYSESGDINLISGLDIIISPASSTKRDYMPGVPYYTVASFDGNMHINAGRDLNLTGGGVLQNAVGNILVEISRDVLLEENGAIRTTGRMATWDETDPELQAYMPNGDPTEEVRQGVIENLRSQRFWEYRDGGDISLRVSGAVKGTVETGADIDASTGWEGAYWDVVSNTDEEKKFYHWSANYGASTAFSINGTSTAPTHGIAAMGGGNITIETDGDFLAQTGAFGQNNEASLSILSRGDLDGRFLTMKGTSRLSTLGSFGTTVVGSTKADIATGIGIGDTPLTVQAMGSVAIGAIYNPTLANAFSKDPRTGLQSRLTYTAESGVHISAFNGSALLSGSSDYANFSGRYTVLPGTLTMAAAHDISFSSGFIMAPAPEGGLVLLAGQDINGRYAGIEGQIDNSSSLLMSDADMSNYDIRTDNADDIVSSLANHHSNPPLHQDDTTPVHIEARNNIAKIHFTVPKQAQIIAGNDLLNITYSGQNLRADDESIIAAGHDINQQEVIGTYKNVFQGITQAGPGFLLVQAGNNLDLADSSGIQSLGSTMNPALQDPDIPVDDNGRIKGSDITVIVGYDIRPSSTETSDFLSKLKTEVRNVSALIADGKDSEAAALKEKIRAELFTPFLYDHRSGTGTLNMTTSSLQAIAGNDAINIFAAGDVNVGVTIMESEDSTKNIGDKETGIFTAGGGPVNLIAEGDVNVNESRVMTFLGGDIVILSDKGDVNAGRGSKAKVTAQEPQIVETKDENGKTTSKSVIFSPPAVGSGLRTLAYDPDGNGPRITPEPGDMYVVAWDGIVDAGEAGIEGGKLYLAATQVLNAQNISVGAGSVGVPAAGGAVASLGALTGDSMSATESTTSDIAKNTAGADDKMAETAKKIADTISQLRFFVVKFLGFME